jgi:CHASE2 domain-containing sensor protein/signal transduction histidine kinase
MTPRSPPTRRRVLIEWALVALVSTAVVAFLAAERITTRPDNLIYDGLSKLAVRPPADDIVIVAIDNRSIDALGRWPWPRARHEALLRRLAEARPKAIAYDVLFVDPDREPEVDVALASAVRAAAPVFLPLTFDVPGENGAPFQTILPVEPLREAAAGMGQVNIEFDPDGVVRRAFLAEGDGTRTWPHLMELLYRAARGGVSRPYASGANRGQPSPAGLVREKSMLIPFAGPPGHFRTISAVDIVRGETPTQFLRGKLVLVGSTADGLGDRYATPQSGGTQIMPGVELQANLLDALLTDRVIRSMGPAWAALLSLAPLWLLLAGFLWLRPRANMLLGAGLLVATLAASAVLFLLGRIWIPPTAAMAGLLIVYPLWSWRRLEASSAYMIQELHQFAQEPDLLSSLSSAGDGAPGDVIARQVDLMRTAIARARDLRRFVTDTLQGLPDATLVTGLDERILIANREADQLFGTLADSAPVGRSLAELTATFTPTPATAPGEQSPGSAEVAPDIEMTARDGRAFNVRRTTVQNADGEGVGWIIRFTDISALKAAGRQREEILQLLTHDMRSPQVSILALLDGAGDETAPPKLAERIGGYARRTLALADNFVHLARAETEHYVMEPVDLGDLLLDAVDDLWPQSSAKQIEVTTQGGDEEHLVLADRSLLTRTLINLIDNAIKYTAPGGLVRCRLDRGATGEEVVCTIVDNGRGMSAEQLSRLFERFQRAPSGGQSHIDGVGLGLAFVHAVVLRHGGAIRCESLPDQGTTFTMTLPLIDEPPSAVID